MSVAEDIRARLAALRPERIELVDESGRHQGHPGARPGGDTHWRLAIVSPAFAGKATLARHRMVYDALAGLMNDPIHALAITACTPEEARAAQSNASSSGYPLKGTS